MAANPVPWLILVLATSLFQAMIFGDPIEEQEFEDFGEDPPSGIDIIGDIIAIVWGVVLKFFTFLVAPIPDAPIIIRALLGFINGSVIVWSIATFIRGN